MTSRSRGNNTANVRSYFSKVLSYTSSRSYLIPSNTKQESIYSSLTRRINYKYLTNPNIKDISSIKFLSKNVKAFIRKRIKNLNYNQNLYKPNPKLINKALTYSDIQRSNQTPINLRRHKLTYSY